MIRPIFVESLSKTREFRFKFALFSKPHNEYESVRKSHKWEVQQHSEMHYLCTDHGMIRQELKYLIGGKVVMLKCRVFGDKTGPVPMGRVFRVV